jgi:hypothetical protein
MDFEQPILYILTSGEPNPENQKSLDFCQMFVISKKKALTLGKKTIS